MLTPLIVSSLHITRAAGMSNKQTFNDFFIDQRLLVEGSLIKMDLQVVFKNLLGMGMFAGILSFDSFDLSKRILCQNE